MELASGAYPLRTLIRYKAHTKLVEALPHHPIGIALDAPLLWDVTNTLLQPSTSPGLYRPYLTRDQAAQVEERTADEIASAYLRIKQQSADPVVQGLNKLL